MSFFYNISLKEEGYELFNASAMQLLETILTNLHFSTRDMITAISISIVKYMSKIEKAVPQILKTMHGSGERILHEINKRRDEILALEDHNEACLQFIKLTQHLQNYSQLLHKLAHQCPPSILEGIADAGVFTTALKLLSIPQFEQKNDIVRMLKQLSHADEVSFPKLVANELKDSLGELD
jgi:E3 ubiquitin-protein ligase HUWE1